jgi:hypothetical protein
MLMVPGFVLLAIAGFYMCAHRIVIASGAGGVQASGAGHA